jgi:hypothetical protein
MAEKNPADDSSPEPREPFAGLFLCNGFTSSPGFSMNTSLTALPLTAILLLSACATNDLGDSRDLNKNNRGKGALIGAVGGGLAVAH